MNKNVIFGLIIVLFWGLLVELVSGYYLFRKASHYFTENKSSLHYFTINNFNLSSLPPEVSQENPFRKDYSANKISYHPFWDFSGAFGNYHKENELDYFGFRNKQNYYHEENRNYNLIVMTGGSEVAGYNHKETISNYLEQYLNNKGKQKFRVLNLGMNGYSIGNEINTYLALAYHLKPEFVISHNGYSSLINMLGIPTKFKELGMSYHKDQLVWLGKLYGYMPDEGYKDDIELNTDELILSGYLKNILKYKSIVESGIGQLIVGVQGIDFGNIKLKDDIDPEKTKAMGTLIYDLRNALKSKNNVVDFAQHRDLKYIDGIHSSEESAKEIARVYSEIIRKLDRS